MYQCQRIALQFATDLAGVVVGPDPTDLALAERYIEAAVGILARRAPALPLSTFRSARRVSAGGARERTQVWGRGQERGFAVIEITGPSRQLSSWCLQDCGTESTIFVTAITATEPPTR